jgi:GT2 family glycosyltransferase
MLKGIVLTTFDDLDMSRVMWSTLQSSLDDDCRLCVVDAGSKDGSVEFWKELSTYDPRVYVIAKEQHRECAIEHLSVALNVSLKWLISIGCEYLFWIHADMKFEDKEWIQKLVKHMQEHADYGKISPEVYNDQDGCHNEERPGNSCPWIMHKSTLLAIDELRTKKGGHNRSLFPYDKEFFNERFIGIGGREDWDLNNQVLDLGLKVMISPCTRVFHVGMGTRSRRDTNPEARHNAGVYHSIYGNTAPKV